MLQSPLLHRESGVGTAAGEDPQAAGRRRIGRKPSGDKKHKCSQCEKSYSRYEHLSRHRLNHNPKCIYSCPVPGCKRTFVRPDLCIRHKTRHCAKVGLPLLSLAAVHTTTCSSSSSSSSPPPSLSPTSVTKFKKINSPEEMKDEEESPISEENHQVGSSQEQTNASHDAIQAVHSQIPSMHESHDDLEYPQEQQQPSYSSEARSHASSTPPQVDLLENDNPFPTQDRTAYPNLPPVQTFKETLAHVPGTILDVSPQQQQPTFTSSSSSLQDQPEQNSYTAYHHLQQYPTPTDAPLPSTDGNRDPLLFSAAASAEQNLDQSQRPFGNDASKSPLSSPTLSQQPPAVRSSTGSSTTSPMNMAEDTDLYYAPNTLPMQPHHQSSHLDTETRQSSLPSQTLSFPQPSQLQQQQPSSFYLYNNNFPASPASNFLLNPSPSEPSQPMMNSLLMQHSQEEKQLQSLHMSSLSQPVHPPPQPSLQQQTPSSHDPLPPPHLTQPNLMLYLNRDRLSMPTLTGNNTTANPSTLQNEYLHSGTNGHSQNSVPSNPFFDPMMGGGQAPSMGLPGTSDSTKPDFSTQLLLTEDEIAMLLMQTDPSFSSNSLFPNQELPSNLVGNASSNVAHHLARSAPPPPLMPLAMDALLAMKTQSIFHLIHTRFTSMSKDDGYAHLAPMLREEDHNEDHHVLSAYMMDQYLDSYWEVVHPQLSILHKATFRPNSVPDLLLVVMMSLGSEHTLRQSMSSSSSSSTSASSSAPVAAPVSSSSSSTPSSSASLDGSGGGGGGGAATWSVLPQFLAHYARIEVMQVLEMQSPAPLWALQALTLLSYSDMFLSSRGHHDRSNQMHHEFLLSVMKRDLRFQNRLYLEADYESDVAIDGEWAQWAKEEALTRLVLTVGILDATWASLFGVAPRLAISDIHVAMPCNDVVWYSDTPKEAMRLRSRLMMDSMTLSLHEAIQRTMSQKSTHTTILGRRAIMASLVSIISQCQHHEQQQQQQQQPSLSQQQQGYIPNIPDAHFLSCFGPSASSADGMMMNGFSSTGGAANKRPVSWQDTMLSALDYWKDDLFQYLQYAPIEQSLTEEVSLLMYHFAHILVRLPLTNIYNLSGSRRVLGEYLFKDSITAAREVQQAMASMPDTAVLGSHIQMLLHLTMGAPTEKTVADAGLAPADARPATQPPLFSSEPVQDPSLLRGWLAYLAAHLDWNYHMSGGGLAMASS